MLAGAARWAGIVKGALDRLDLRKLGMVHFRTYVP
jgi:hypothetical protein